MSWSDWAQLAAELYGAYSSNKGNKDATNASVAGSQAGIDEIRREFDVNNANQQSWINGGKWAIPRYQDTLDGKYTDFFNSPDYLATQEQGVKTMDRSAASHGRMNSGGYGMDLMKYGQQLGAQQLGNYRSALGTLAGYGQNSAQNIGAAGANMASNIANQYNNMGQARASGYGYNAYNNANTATNLGKLFQNWGNG